MSAREPLDVGSVRLDIRLAAATAAWAYGRPRRFGRPPLGDGAFASAASYRAIVALARSRFAFCRSRFLRTSEVGFHLPQLLVDLGRCDLRQELARLHVVPDVHISLAEVPAGAGVDDRVLNGLGRGASDKSASDAGAGR